MSSCVRSIKVEYCPVNGDHTFTNGDMVSGHVALTLDKQCHIQQLFVKFKGKAEAQWADRSRRTTFSSKEKYFSIKRFFINPDENSSVVPPGCHLYPFSFQFPDQGIPASFKGPVGKIVYTLEARLSRKMRMDSKSSTTLTFIPKTVSLPPLYTLMGLDLQTPQHYYKEKTMSLLTSGAVAMDAHLDKMGYCQGEGIKVVANVQNNSSRTITPKYCVYSKHSYYAEGERIVKTKDLLKEVGDYIRPSGHQTITRIITIPPDMDPSILNCNIIHAEYRLRVYLDVKFAADPKIKFPIVILPASRSPTRTPAEEQRPFILPASRTPNGTLAEERPFILPASRTHTGTPTEEQRPFILPASRSPAVEQPPAYSGFGREALGRPGQPAWSIVGSYGTNPSQGYNSF